MESDMDLLIDMMPEENLLFETVIERDKTNEYYQGMGEHFLKQIDTTEHYFHFLMTIMKQYQTLSNEQKQKIISFLDIQPAVKIITKEKIIYKVKEHKGKLNTYDDY